MISPFQIKSGRIKPGKFAAHAPVSAKTTVQQRRLNKICAWQRSLVLNVQQDAGLLKIKTEEMLQKAQFISQDEMHFPHYENFPLFCPSNFPWEEILFHIMKLEI